MSVYRSRKHRAFHRQIETVLVHSTVRLTRYFLLDGLSSMADSPCKIETVCTVSRRDGNYPKDEGIAIIRAYNYVSMDTVFELDQTRGVYYRGIWESHRTKKPGAAVQGTIFFVRTRFRLVLKESVRFKARVKTVTNSKKSGQMESDEVNLASAMLSKRTVSHLPEENEKSFIFLSCRYFLCDSPEFQALCLSAISSTLLDAADETSRIATHDGRRQRGK